MRISEKSVELNFCAQLSRLFAGRLLWFGLTQRQEARAGFDACTRLGGRLLLIQFKASAHSVHSPHLGGALARRFHVQHAQLVALQARTRPDRHIVYAFPLIGTTNDVHHGGDFISTTWLLDVAALPAIPPPTTYAGTPRKNGVHYVDVIPSRAVMHSQPMPLSLLSTPLLLEILAGQTGRNVAPPDAGDFPDFWPPRGRPFSGRAVGAVVLP